MHTLLLASISSFFIKLLFVLGGGTGGVFFPVLEGLEGCSLAQLEVLFTKDWGGLGLGVLGGVGAGLPFGVVLGVNTNAAGIFTVLSAFWNNLGEEANAAVITLGSICPLFAKGAGGGWGDGVSFMLLDSFEFMLTWILVGKERVEFPIGEGDKELLLLLGGGVVGDLRPSL